MKKIVLMALIAIFTLSFSLEAQDNGKNRKDNRQEARSGMRWTAKDRAENMAKQLELTADEKAKVEALFEQQDAKRAEQMAKHRDERKEKMNDSNKHREEMQVLREKAIAENDAELEAIIGKEKMEQWKQFRAERQKEMRNPNRPRRQATR